jgi:hypothetical protein
MTNEENTKPKYFENLARYRPAAVAEMFYQQKNETAAKSSLEKLVTTLDIGKDGPVLLKAIREGEEGDKTVADIYAQKYQEALWSFKISELFDFYSNYFKKYVKGDSYTESERVFKEEYGNETYKNIFSKVIEAQEKLGSKSPNVTDEDRKKAKSTMEKYSKIVKPLQYFEEKEMSKISEPFAEDALAKDLTEMFKPKEDKK